MASLRDYKRAYEALVCLGTSSQQQTLATNLKKAMDRGDSADIRMATICAEFKDFNPNEPRDWHGRWGEGLKRASVADLSTAVPMWDWRPGRLGKGAVSLDGKVYAWRIDGQDGKPDHGSVFRANPEIFGGFLGPGDDGLERSFQIEANGEVWADPTHRDKIIASDSRFKPITAAIA